MNLQTLAQRSYRHFSTTQCHSAARERLVILGTGWGSYSVLKNANKKLYDIIVISPRNHFLFTPLLCSTTVGTLEFRSIIEPIRNSKFRNESHFHLARAVSLDTEKHLLTCVNTLEPSQEKYDVEYDHLVIGVGARPNTFNVPGVSEHAFFLKEISDARRIRNRILANFEIAISPSCVQEDRDRLHHIVIVGGGPTGVEFGAELYDFVQQDLAKLYGASKSSVRVTLVEANNILSMFDTKLRQYAEKKISQRDQFKLIKDSVAEVREDGVRLKSGKFISCGLVVWSGGVAPTEFVKTLPFKRNNTGQILTDKYLNVLDIPQNNVYSLGDCADIENYSLPCTGQVAERQGRYLSDRLNHKTADEFVYKGVGMMAYIGEYKAVTDLDGLGVKDKGFTSWILWRSAYMTRLGSWRLRMQVPLDWFKTFFFGRDTSRFD